MSLAGRHGHDLCLDASRAQAFDQRAGIKRRQARVAEHYGRCRGDGAKDVVGGALEEAGFDDDRIATVAERDGERAHDGRRSGSAAWARYTARTCRAVSSRLSPVESTTAC